MSTLTFDSFVAAFGSGERRTSVAEMKQFVDAILGTEDYPFDRQESGNFLYEFYPILRICEYLGDTTIEIQYLGLTNKPVDAIIRTSIAEYAVECTTAINFRDRQLKYDTMKQWLKNPEEGYNPLAQVEITGSKKTGYKVLKYCDKSPRGEVIELNLYAACCTSLSKKLKPRKIYTLIDWYIISFEPYAYRETTLRSFVNILSEITQKRVFMVGTFSNECIFDSSTRRSAR